MSSGKITIGRRAEFRQDGLEIIEKLMEAGLVTGQILIVRCKTGMPVNIPGVDLKAIHMNADGLHVHEIASILREVLAEVEGMAQTLETKGSA